MCWPSSECENNTRSDVIYDEKRVIWVLKQKIESNRCSVVQGNDRAHMMNYRQFCFFLLTRPMKLTDFSFVIICSMDPTNRTALDQLEQLEQLGVRSGKILVSTDLTATVTATGDIIPRPPTGSQSIDRDLEMERARELREQRERVMAQRERLREQEIQRRQELHDHNDAEMRSSSTNESNAENMGSDSDGVWSEGDNHIPMRDD